MKRLSLLLFGGTALLVSTPVLASNTATISQVGDDGYLVVTQDTQGRGSATITQTGLRNQIQVDQTEGLHNPPGDHNPPGYRNAATIVQEGRDNAINHGLLLPAVHPGQNNTVVAFQQGNGATALVTQGGTGNFTQISH